MPATTGNMRMDSRSTLQRYGSARRLSYSSCRAGIPSLVIKPAAASSSAMRACTAGLVARAKSVKDSVCAVVSKPPIINVPISACSCASDSGRPARLRINLTDLSGVVS